jgi:hypothetical protein
MTTATTTLTLTDREMRGLSTHSDSLRANARTVLEAQLTLLVFAAIAEVLRTKAPATFEGGRTHPHTMVRYMMQQVHFMTLILSNFPETFTQGHARELDAWLQEVLLLLTVIGLVPPPTESLVMDDGHFAAVRRAGGDRRGDEGCRVDEGRALLTNGPRQAAERRVTHFDLEAQTE